MQVFLFHAGSAFGQWADLEHRIKARLPQVQAVERIEEIVKSLPPPRSGNGALACVLFPVVLSARESFDRMVSIAGEYRDRLFFIFISDDIPASDYKRLVQTGGADWASTRNAPDEVAEILGRMQKGGGEVAEPPAPEPVMVAFVPSAGGVGNSTLAIEVAIQLKNAKKTRGRRVCLLDMDFQNSHVCDYLDIEPRMKIGEIAANPERLDDQLFGLFVSHHGSGLDVLAAPRSKDAAVDLGFDTLEALFRIIAARYDLVLLDLPVTWLGWTRQLLSSSEIVFVTGLNTIPGLRQVAGTLGAVRAVDRIPARVSVVLNRCEHRLVGGFARRTHVKNLLGAEDVLFVREDVEAAVQSVNTGIPMGAPGQSGRLGKDIDPIATLVADAKPVSSTQARA